MLVVLLLALVGPATPCWFGWFCRGDEGKSQDQVVRAQTNDLKEAVANRSLANSTLPHKCCSSVEVSGEMLEVVGSYTAVTINGSEVLEQESGGRATIREEDGRWRLVVVETRPDRSARVMASFSYPSANTSCPEDTPRLLGGYLSLGKEVVVTCSKPDTIFLYVTLASIAALFVISFSLCLCLCRYKKTPEQLLKCDAGSTEHLCKQ